MNGEITRELLNVSEPVKHVSHEPIVNKYSIFTTMHEYVFSVGENKIVKTAEHSNDIVAVLLEPDTTIFILRYSLLINHNIYHVGLITYGNFHVRNLEGIMIALDLQS